MIIYEEILRDFQKEKVRFVLVGGIAFNLLGGLRNTADLDILVEMSDENLAKIVKILKHHGYMVKQPVDPMGIADKKTREDWVKNKNMKAFNFYKEKGLKEVDIIIQSPVAYDRARKDAILIKADGLRIYVISVDNLIKMKKNTGRAVDQLDVKELRIMKRLRREHDL